MTVTSRHCGPITSLWPRNCACSMWSEPLTCSAQPMFLKNTIQMKILWWIMLCAVMVHDYFRFLSCSRQILDVSILCSLLTSDSRHDQGVRWRTFLEAVWVQLHPPFSPPHLVVKSCQDSINLVTLFYIRSTLAYQSTHTLKEATCWWMPSVYCVTL